MAQQPKKSVEPPQNPPEEKKDQPPQGQENPPEGKDPKDQPQGQDFTNRSGEPDNTAGDPEVEEDRSDYPEVTYTRPTSQVDLERRLENDNAAPRILQGVNPTHVNEDNGYVGVSPEYQNAANETDEPLSSEEGADLLAEEEFLDSTTTTEGSEPMPEVKERYEDQKKGVVPSGSSSRR